MTGSDDAIGKLFLHVKSNGLYRVLNFAIIEATNTEAVVYQSEETGIIWVRPSLEFFDGRFVCQD